AGLYQITISRDVTLIFSMLGYRDTEISTGSYDQDEIDIVLYEESLHLDEVTVTGYSEVESRHVASSVASVDMEDLKSGPIFKLQEAFSGTIPGVTLMQGNNLPGSVPGPISIRGISTLQNASPLVIVDGMEQSLTDIDPN